MSAGRALGDDGVSFDGRFRCWCCGQLTLVEQPVGTFEICSNCGWEDDGVQLADPDRAGGANSLSLREARRDFLAQEATQAYWHAGNQHGQPRIAVQIPDWPPVDLDEGAEWLGSRVAEGWFVGYRVCALGGDVIIWMKYWEYGDPEPDFPPGACQ